MKTKYVHEAHASKKARQRRINLKVSWEEYFLHLFFNTSCMYPRNFWMSSFSIRGQSSKGGGHELLVKSDIGDTLNIGVVLNHWHLMMDHVHAIIHHHHNYACTVEDSEDGAESLDCWC